MEYFSEPSMKEVVTNQMKAASPLLVFHFCISGDLGSILFSAPALFLSFRVWGGRRLIPQA